MKKIITVLLSCIMLISLTGCAMFESKINDIKGNLVGNGYTIDTFDNYGKRIMTATLEPNVDFTQEDIESNDNGKLSNNTYIANIINKYKNYFGKSRVVVIKSQLGQPITAYSGDEVYWSVPKKLPKMTKMVKLFIFIVQIIKSLIQLC